MKEYTNNGELVTKPTGCWNCEYLEYIEDTSYETQDGGWSCQWNENAENFKDFPCKRKLKCFKQAICWKCEGSGKVRANYTNEKGQYVFHKENCDCVQENGLKQ